MTDTSVGTGGRWPASLVDLDGFWDLIVGDHSLQTMASMRGEEIVVPGLWEAQGHLELDGTAWYRRRVDVPDPTGWWTLHFGAVMDDADVFLNGHYLGSHRGGFTPFALDCTGLLKLGPNELGVRVVDHPRGSAEHGRSAHGKQGWMNDVFPSPPSLYLDYGGIWQSVSLERHGPVRVADCWANGDPEDLVVAVGLSGAETAVHVEICALGRSERVAVTTGTPVHFALGPTTAASWWSPGQPTLHEAAVAVYVDGRISHRQTLRFGIRTVGVTATSFELNGEPFEMRSALVQGFSARTLYGPVTRAEAEADVSAAQSLGLNTLRLHIKGFDPIYLDVCDERGMLVHCDIPIAEPIAYEELGSATELAELCAAAAVEQVRRDRGHPSIVLWSAMNELGVERLAVRQGPGYEAFVKRIYREVRNTDPTRPVVENDWIEPDPDYVFDSPLLTAHWYGRLTPSYLSELEAKVARWTTVGRPLFVSEFGDWGLPELEPGRTPFWAYGAQLAEQIESTPWPGSAAGFATGTQRYQGLADRFQIELFRRMAGVVGWCVTELTDVPQEFNGLLDLSRGAKGPACDEVRRAAQPVLPIFVRSHWSVATGEMLTGDVIVVNDGPAIDGAEVIVRVGHQEWSERLELPAYGTSSRRAVSLPMGPLPGEMSLDLEVRRGEYQLGANCYPVRALARDKSPVSLTGITEPRLGGLLAEGGAAIADASTAMPRRDLLVIPEASLTTEAGTAVRKWLQDGGNVLVLAQCGTGDVALPVPARLTDLSTAWGSTPFVFTTSRPALPALPPCRVLASELLSTAPEFVFTWFGDGPFAVETAVGALKPPPGPIVGTVVGRLPVLAGRLAVCQLPVTERAIAGDPLCIALLDDLVRWASGP